MTEQDIRIGKIVSYLLFGGGIILFLIASSKLYLYDAEDNGLKTLKEGEFNVEDNNDGYRIYTKHDNCAEVEVELYYESFIDVGDLMWNPSCGGNSFEFGSATSGDWNYIGTVTFEGKFNPESNEITVDFNVSASHEVMITDREPIVDGLSLRTISLAVLGLGGLIFGVTKKLELDNSFLQNHISSTTNQTALEALASLKNHIVANNISHAELFSSFDLNDDGTIDHFELMSGLKSAGIEGLSPTDIEDLVSLLDLNGDGKIDLHEVGLVLDQNL